MATHLENLTSIWQTVVKYSTIANGAALALALNSIAKHSDGTLTFPVGKFPLWCFVLGLLSGSLHLLFSFSYHLGSAGGDVQAKEAKIRDVHAKRSEEIKSISETVSQLPMGESRARLETRLATLTEHVKKIEAELSEEGLGNEVRTLVKAIPVLRFLQEAALWAAYLFFFVGVFWAIAVL